MFLENSNVLAGHSFGISDGFKVAKDGVGVCLGSLILPRWYQHPRISHLLCGKFWPLVYSKVVQVNRTTNAASEDSKLPHKWLHALASLPAALNRDKFCIICQQDHGNQCHCKHYHVSETVSYCMIPRIETTKTRKRDRALFRTDLATLLPLYVRRQVIQPSLFETYWGLDSHLKSLQEKCSTSV